MYEYTKCIKYINFIKMISIYVIKCHNLPRFQSMDVPKFRTEYCKYSPLSLSGR